MTFQRLTKRSARPRLLIGGDARDDVAGQTAHDVGLLGGKVEPLDHQRDDRGEGVTVAETNRRTTMAAAARFHAVSTATRSPARHHSDFCPQGNR